MTHHLAIVYRTYLEEILNGRKTVECRLGQVSAGPHLALQPGHLIWLKQMGGPVRAVVTARSVRRFQPLTPRLLDLIRRKWGPLIRTPAGFWRANRHARIATLVWLGDLCTLEPFTIEKRDARAWVVLDGPLMPGQRV